MIMYSCFKNQMGGGRQKQGEKQSVPLQAKLQSFPFVPSFYNFALFFLLVELHPIKVSNPIVWLEILMRGLER